jgi:hypothetical protein
MYADDVVIHGPDPQEIQLTLNAIHTFFATKQLEINVAKTKAMKFRNGGRLRATDKFHLNHDPIEIVNQFKYLGLTITPTAKSFTPHILDRVQKAVYAGFHIPNVRALSLVTALKLFKLKVSPMASYGIDVIWRHLSSSQLHLLDKVKPTFLKRVLGVSRYSRNRIVYLVCGTPTLVEDLKTTFRLETTPAYERFLLEQEQKFTEIHPQLFDTPAMTTDAWKQTNRVTRHSVTRHAMHGYHHLICYNTTYHTADDDCICRLCGEECSQYHLLNCRMNSQSLNFWAQE